MQLHIDQLQDEMSEEDPEELVPEGSGLLKDPLGFIPDP